MKTPIYILLVILVSLACKKSIIEEPNTTNTEVIEITPIIQDDNKVLILKIDYLTYAFETGTELLFYDTSSFTISSNYNSPGDFGDIQLYYEEFNALLFDGTIIWMGTGAQSYPYTMNTADEFLVTNQNLQMPTLSHFETIHYSNFTNDIDSSDYAQIWESVSNLEILKTYRNSNPSGKIHTFLYTPSVGVGNPEEWDWYIFLNN